MKSQRSPYRWPLLHSITLTLALFHLLKGQDALVVGQGPLDIRSDDENSALVHCGPGQRLVTLEDAQHNEECEPCPDSTYMSTSRHRNPECIPCARLISKRKMIVTPCTGVSNTVIGCLPGYYKRPAGTDSKDFTCMNCRNCSTETPSQFVGRPCQGEDNTFCCEKPGMEVVGGTCSHQSHTVKVCALGFFDSKSTPSGEVTEPSCRPCTVCSSLKNGDVYEARPCGRSMDTVCCSRPNANTHFNSETGLYQCQYPAAGEPKSHPENPPTESHNPEAGGGNAARTSPSSKKEPCTNYHPNTTIVTVFIVLFVFFFVISMVLGTILGFPKFKNWKRRRSATPKLSQERRRRESLLNNDPNYCLEELQSMSG